VYKTQVYALARWRNGVAGFAKGEGDVIPRAVIERAPSAELRADQTDQDSLPAYDVLDGILKRCVEGAESRAEIVAAGYVPDDVRRVVRMLQASEFKRRQAAPGPRVSTCAFGRERRYPISNAWR
jgi:NAD+ synthase (glutamine-hydrolysing)